MSGDKFKILLLSAVLIILFPVFMPCFSQAQNKTQLRKEKENKLKKIKEVEKILNETTNQKQHSLGELNALNERIREQEGLIGSIKREVNYLNAEIEETNMIISSLNEDLASLKEEYKAMVYATYKANLGLNKLTFIFSASSFSELRARIKYMEQYGETRKKQAEQIKKVTATLAMQVQVIEQNKLDKISLIEEQTIQNRQLITLKNTRSKVVESLVQKEDELIRGLEETRKAVALLENKINKIIDAELAAASKSTTASSSIAVLSSTFEKNKTKFPWPVEDGFVSQKFGKQQHVALKGVIVENDGIYIQTSKNGAARAIFDGDVLFVGYIQAKGYSALIKHGDYYTVYSGMKEPLIKVGEKVKTGQILGEIVTRPEGVTELMFQIRKGRDPLNPELWLVKK